LISQKDKGNDNNNPVFNASAIRAHTALHVSRRCSRSESKTKGKHVYAGNSTYQYIGFPSTTMETTVAALELIPAITAT